VLDQTSPFVAPVTGYAFSVDGAVATSNKEINKVRDAARLLFGAAGSYTSPAGGVYSGMSRDY